MDIVTLKKAVKDAGKYTPSNPVPDEWEPTEVAEALDILAGNFDQVGLELNAKANKQQEGWKTLQLMNGWEPVVPTRYFKDTFGIVHVQGYISGGVTASSTQIARLPVGYRPDGYIYPIAIQGNRDALILGIPALGWIILGHSAAEGSSIVFMFSFKAGE